MSTDRAVDSRASSYSVIPMRLGGLCEQYHNTAQRTRSAISPKKLESAAIAISALLLPLVGGRSRDDRGAFPTSPPLTFLPPLFREPFRAPASPPRKSSWR